MEIELFLKNALKKIRLKIMAIVPAPYLNISVCCIILLEIASVGCLKAIPDGMKNKLYKNINRKNLIFYK